MYAIIIIERALIYLGCNLISAVSSASGVSTKLYSCSRNSKNVIINWFSEVHAFSILPCNISVYIRTYILWCVHIHLFFIKKHTVTFKSVDRCVLLRKALFQFYFFHQIIKWYLPITISVDIINDCLVRDREIIWRTVNTEKY